MKKLYLLFVLIYFANGVVFPRIPNHLLECYRGGGPYQGAPRRLDVLLTLLRKLELNSQMDVRMFSTALLRSLRLDGIERAASTPETEFVLPYRASAFQFHKYKLLMDLFLPSQNTLEVDERLSSEEKCLLHGMLSSAVQQWERGDENVACPLSAEQRQNMATEGSTRVHSRCPIEVGVIQTDWGTISPGTLVAAIAASLEGQRVSVTDILNADVFQEDVSEHFLDLAKQEWFEDIETLNTKESGRQTATAADISNIWVATLAGDLSEVVINQGPRVGAAPQRMLFSSNSRWNDTLLPRRHYLLPAGAAVDWHFTDAEILAGIDGLILAQHVPTWVDQRRTLRLAQIIDMYYSNEGVSFEPSVRACNRQALFNDLFNSSDLLSETSRFAHMLSLKQITVSYTPLEEMDRITVAAVTAFVNYVPSLLRQTQQNCQLSHSVPAMDLIVATDGSWKGYDVERFISWVGGALELDLQRSTLALLHGTTGQWVVPPSNNLTNIFSYINNFTDGWPTRLNLPRVISSTIQHSLNKTLAEVSRSASAGASTVVLVLSPSDRPPATELDRARELMHTLRATYFDVYFAYAASELTDFQNINNEYLDYSELFFKTPSTNVQDVISVVDTYLLKSEIPTRLVGVHCPANGTVYNQVEYEDFVLPARTKSYRIHPFYLRQQSLVNVQFRNNGQGRLLVCAWRGADESHNCQRINEREVHIFNLTRPCPSPEFCLPAHFDVTAINSSNLCTHNECRVPHEVGYYLQHAGLRCLSLRSSTLSLSPPWILHLTLSFIISCLYLI